MGFSIKVQMLLKSNQATTILLQQNRSAWLSLDALLSTSFSQLVCNFTYVTKFHYVNLITSTYIILGLCSYGRKCLSSYPGDSGKQPLL